MRTKLIAGGAFVVVLGIVGYVLFRGGGEARRAPPATDTPAPPTAEGPRATPSPNLPEHNAPAHVAGTVRDAFSRQPVPEVEIRFVGDVEVIATSGADGRFQTELEPGRYLLTAAADGLVAPRVDTLLVAAGARVTDLDVTVLSTATVDGRVVDGDGVPMEGIEVTCTADGPATCAGVSGDLGRFNLAVPPGRIELAAAMEGRPPAKVLLRWVEPGVQLSGVELVLDYGARISGDVVDRSGTPASAGEVTAWLAGHLVGRAPVQRGVFAIEALPAGTLHVRAMAPGHGESEARAVELVAGGEQQVQLVLGAAQRLRGRVVDGSGKPAPGARVAVRRQGTEHEVGVQATGADGGFDIGSLGLGPYDLIANKAGFAPARRASIGASREGIELTLLAGGGINGAVEANGAPIADFTVSLMHTAALGGGATAAPQVLRFVAPDGAYRIDGLDPGTYDLSVSSPGFAPALAVGLIVPPGAYADGSAQLSQGATIAGSVVNGQNHRPIFGAEVSMSTGHGGELAFTDAEGKFEIVDVAPGRRSVQVRHPGYVGRVESGIEIAAGDRRVLELVLQPRESSAVGDGGEPIEFAGIGAVISWQRDRLIVQGVLPHSPAEVAGLQAADEILEIDGVPTKGRGLGAGIEDIRGVAGTSVRLRIERAGGEPFQLDIVRATVRYPGGE